MLNKNAKFARFYASVDEDAVEYKYKKQSAALSTYN